MLGMVVVLRKGRVLHKASHELVADSSNPPLLFLNSLPKESSRSRLSNSVASFVDMQQALVCSSVFSIKVFNVFL